MLSTFRTSVFLIALAVASSRAAAQQPSLVTLNPTNPTRWDFATLVGWVGGNKSDIAPDWNNWYDTASIEVSGGYYWTRHLKVELGLATTAAAGVSVQERLLSDGFPVFRPREHQFRSTSIGAGVTYQFFENAWFHPFVSTGVSAIHERERAGIALPMTFFRDSQTRVMLPASDTFERTTTSVRPFAAAGFKAYVAERAFIRSDMRVSASSDRAEFVVWRAGVGFDF